MKSSIRFARRPAFRLAAILSLVWLSIQPSMSSAQNLVGSLGGEVAVSHEGLATYSIPIEVVPGTRGVQPGLAVAYCSAGGRGLLGSCWTLAGFSSISRTPRDFRHDGDAGSVNFDGGDRYALDGARLVRLSTGAYAADGAVYGKDVEDFTRVALHGTPDTQSQYFTAVAADGTVTDYGKDVQCGSKQVLNGNVLSWWADRVTDPEGNYMTFQYRTYSGQTVPYRIYYTRNVAANLENYALVTFDYTDDPNPNKTWVGGTPMTATKLLSGITVKYGSAVVRQYAFEYAHDRSSRLTAVVLKDGAGHELTRTSVDWRDHLFVHEYGHYIQSQRHGPAYFFTVGIPSIESGAIYKISNGKIKHRTRWFEADASNKGSTYFDKYYGSGKDGYVEGNADYFDINRIHKPKRSRI